MNVLLWIFVENTVQLSRGARCRRSWSDGVLPLYCRENEAGGRRNWSFRVVSSNRTRLQTMKHNRLLFISIPIGILLSGCFMGQESATTRFPLHTAPLPLFVRHNPGQPVGTPAAAAARTPYITAPLVQDNNNQSYIDYSITAKISNGNPHSKKSSQNEDPTSSLFTTIFPLTDLDLKPTKDQEEIIQAT